MRRTKLPTDDQLSALLRRARVAAESGRETVSVKPETLESLIEGAKWLAQLIQAAKREVAVNNCWCANWPGPETTCSWCQLKHALR